MRSLSLFICSLLFSATIFAQTGIGTTTPDASAKLDVTATNKGFLPPRVTLTSYTDNTTIPNPATGLLIYNTGNNVGLAAGYYYWNGNAWATIATAGGSGSFAASYLRGSKTATQTMAVNDVVTFSQIDNTAGQSISLNTSTGKITLAAGNTYRLIASVPNFTGSRPAFMWYNETNSTYIGSSIDGYTPLDGANAGSFGGISEAIITSSVSTVISFRLVSSLNSGSVTTAGNPDFFSSGIYPWFEAQVISGNAPVTGQSVDYVSVNRTTIQTVNTGDNIVFSTINGGNIPYNTSNGNFTLTAGKTYRLTGSVSLDGSNVGSSEIDIAWKNAAGDVLGNRALILSTNYATAAAGNGVTDIIYTPTVNTTIALNVVYATTNAKTVPNYTYATIEQIGSSAIVNPWTLSGSTTYNTLGNVGIGTTTPAASAVLDLTSSTQGFLPPRVALTATNNASPLTSPVTGTVVYNNASAGSFPNQVTPGYYYWNGSIWTRIGNSNIIASSTVTLSAVTTNPTTGTRYMDRTYAVDNGATKRIVVQLGFSGGSAGSGDYLFSLPSGVTFNTAAGFNPTYTGTLWSPTIADMSYYFIPLSGGIVQAGSWNYYGYVIPYSSTQYRIALPNNGVAGFYYLSSGWYTTNSQTTLNFSFDIW